VVRCAPVSGHCQFVAAPEAWRQVGGEWSHLEFGGPYNPADCALARSVLKPQENMRARVASGDGNRPRARVAVVSRWLAGSLTIMAALLVLVGWPEAARAQTTSNNSLTRLSSPNNAISMVPNAQGVERRRDYYTPTRPWWINYEDCRLDDVFTFSIESQVVGDTLEIWAGSDDCATNRSNSNNLGQCWILAAVPLQSRTNTVRVPARNIVARILNTTTPPTSVGPEVCDDSIDPTGEELTLYFMVVNSGQGGESFAWDGGTGGIGFDMVGPSPPGRISVGVGESQLSIALDNISTDPQRQRYEAFCVPRGTMRESSGLDAGADPESTGTATPAVDAGDGGIGDGGLDAGSSGGALLDGGSGEDPNAAPQACFTDLLRVGARPPAEFSCGRTNAVSRKLDTSRLTNYVDYAVAVSGQDALGNAGPVSQIQCGRPILLADFFEIYDEAGGPGGGGFCNFALGRQSPRAAALGAATLALALAAVAARRRRSRA
jgi:hypothetical protein